jgi:hypothetical protein
MFSVVPPSMRTMGLTIEGYRPSFRMKFGWSLQSKVIGTSDHFRYSGMVGPIAMTFRVVSFCFLHDYYVLGAS